MAVRTGLSLTPSLMMDSMMAGLEMTGVSLLLLPFAAMQQLQTYTPLSTEGYRV